MPIKVACQCGQQFVAKDELAGKRVQCPKCRAVLTIPQPRAGQDGSGQHLADLLDDVGLRAGLRRCPGCGAELGESAVLCVMCGYDTRIRRRLKTHTGSAIELDDEELGELPVHGVEALDRAERQIARDKIEQKRMIKGTPWWMLLLALLGLIGFAIGMVSMDQTKVVERSGLILQIGGFLLYLFYWIRMIVVAFQESVLQGIAFLIVPFYWLLYIITRWDRVGGLFIFSLVGGFIYGAGIALVALSPMLQPKEESYAPRELRPRAAVVRVVRDVALV